MGSLSHYTLLDRDKKPQDRDFAFVPQVMSYVPPHEGDSWLPMKSGPGTSPWSNRFSAYAAEPVSSQITSKAVSCRLASSRCASTKSGLRQRQRLGVEGDQRHHSDGPQPAERAKLRSAVTWKTIRALSGNSWYSMYPRLLPEVTYIQNAG